MSYMETVIKIKAFKQHVEKLEESLYKYLKTNDVIVLENGDKFTLLEKEYGDFKVSSVVNYKGDKVKKRKFLKREDAVRIVSINGELV